MLGDRLEGAFLRFRKMNLTGIFKATPQQFDCTPLQKKTP